MKLSELKPGEAKLVSSAGADGGTLKLSQLKPGEAKPVDINSGPTMDEVVERSKATRAELAAPTFVEREIAAIPRVAENFATAAGGAIPGGPAVEAAVQAAMGKGTYADLLEAIKARNAKATATPEGMTGAVAGGVAALEAGGGTPLAAILEGAAGEALKKTDLPGALRAAAQGAGAGAAGVALSKVLPGALARLAGSQAPASTGSALTGAALAGAGTAAKPLLKGAGVDEDVANAAGTVAQIAGAGKAVPPHLLGAISKAIAANPAATAAIVRTLGADVAGWLLGQLPANREPTKFEPIDK